MDQTFCHISVQIYNVILYTDRHPESHLLSTVLHTEIRYCSLQDCIIIESKFKRRRLES